MQTTTREFRAIRALCWTYLAATVATVAFLAWKNDDHALVTQHAWGHEVILLVFAVVLVRVAGRAAAGNPRAYLRLRIVAIVVAVASLVVAAIPGFLPEWMRVEQLLYGILVAAVAVLAHRPAVRRSFARG